MTGAVAWLAAHRKAALAALGTGATLIVTLGLDNRYPWLAVVVAVATAAGVYQVRNVPVPPPEKTLMGRPPLGPGVQATGNVQRLGPDTAPPGRAGQAKAETGRLGPQPRKVADNPQDPSWPQP